MRISDILRACADFMEETLDNATRGLPKDWYDRPRGERPSWYICDNLRGEDGALTRPKTYAPGCTEGECHAAQDFLHDLGMGSGHAEFPSGDHLDNGTPESQLQRVCWLHFAADVWDEWNPSTEEQPQ